MILADDNADMRDHVRRVLGDQFAVEAVADGEAALAAVRSDPPALVLSDVMMPRLDGFGLLRALRADPRLRHIPVILLSARAGDEAKSGGLEASADDYLTKPFSARELRARVGTNIALARLRQEAGREAEIQKARLQTVLNTVPTAVWFTFDAQARTATGNRQAAHLLRMHETANASLSAVDGERPRHFAAFRDGVALAPTDLPLQRAARGETVANEEVELRFTDGGALTLLMQAAPLVDEAGQVGGAVCACLDITERKRHEERQWLLLNELNHRVKNTLATVQSVAMQTLRNSQDLDQARHLFEGRLMALSKAHDILTQERWEGAPLDLVIEKAVAPYRGQDPERFEVEGPSVWVPPKYALALAMGLHELCTNAVKYGALSNEIGQVRIIWAVAGQAGGRELRLQWTEREGPLVVPPTRRGFGSRLIERGLKQELGGEVAIVFAPTGLVCTIMALLDPATGPLDWPIAPRRGTEAIDLKTAE